MSWAVYWLPRSECRITPFDPAATHEHRPRHSQGDQLGAHVIIDRPAQHPPRMLVADRTQVHVALTAAQIA